jgi:hypothetical protein
MGTYDQPPVRPQGVAVKAAAMTSNKPRTSNKLNYVRRKLDEPREEKRMNLHLLEEAVTELREQMIQVQRRLGIRPSVELNLEDILRRKKG